MISPSTSVAMTICPASSAEDDLATRVALNLSLIRDRIIATGRSPDDISVVAVTNTFGPEHVAAAHAAGLTTVGENYAQELARKRPFVDVPMVWQYLGALQTNKIHQLCAVSDLIASVSRVKELEKIATASRRVPIYLQIDFTGRTERNGARLEDLPGLLSRAEQLEIDVRGLMTVAAPGPSAAASFHDLRAAVDDFGLSVCSMGMTEDLEAACEQGSNEIRVGRGLFGQR